MKPSERRYAPSKNPVRGNTTPPRRAALALLLLITLTVSACAPAAEWLRDRLDSGDATLEYTTAGVIFDPGATPAYGVRITLRGENLELAQEQPACQVTEDQRYIDCDYPIITSRTTVHATGQGVIGSAVYTREPDSVAWRWAYTPVN